MSQADTASSSRPLLVSSTQAVLKVVGALYLTVLILVALVAILLWGMLVEKQYGDTAARFGIYGSWWFNALGAVLALNATSALILRLPWKRRDLGFILPHLGLVVLLFGCLLSRRCGVEATVAVAERQSKSEAYKSLGQYLELDGQQHFLLAVASDDPQAEDLKPISVRFTPGPFNWEDYQTTLPWFPWHVAHRDRGVIYDRDGIRLEVLDYLSKSQAVEVPRLVVQATPLTPDGRPRSEEAKVVTLRVATPDDWQKNESPLGIGQSQPLKLKGNPRLLFWMTGSREETAAFRQSKPEGPLGRLGRIVLRAKGLDYQWPLDGWKTGERHDLGQSGLSVELLSVDRMLGEVRLQVRGGPEAQVLHLSAESPADANRQDYADEVFGTYWLGPDSPAVNETDGKAHAAATPVATPRIDLVQGFDRKIYMRTWRAGEVEISGPLNLQAGVTAFGDTPDSLRLRFGDFQSAERPHVLTIPLAFDGNKDDLHLRQAEVQLTVDGQSEKFWLAGLSHDPIETNDLEIPNRQKVKIVSGKGRRVAISLEADWFPLGATIYLRNAWRKLDPGSAMRSYYASKIDLTPIPSADHKTDGNLPAQENLLVTLNAPLDFTDPASGLSYRMFQSAMPGPYDPESLGGEPGPPVYLSIFTINHDPGRGLTYLGCLLIVAGIFVAYFGRKLTTPA